MKHSILEILSQVLNNVSVDAVSSYERKIAVIVDQVNMLMKQREDLGDLIGTNSPSLMEANHDNHAHFLSTQLYLQSAPTLAEGVTWAYRTYTQRGFSPYYFPIELQTWQQAIAQHLDDKHATAINAVYQAMIDCHPDFLFLSRSPANTESGFTIEEPLLSYFKRYLDALLEPNMKAAVTVSKEYITSAEHIPIWWERVIMPCMYEIGRLWADGVITVGQEHIATSITQRVISTFYPMILDLPRNRGAIIVAVSPDELHEIGARMVADILELHGWDVYYTGANTPEDSLIDLIRAQEARHLCISTTLPSNLKSVSSIIRHVRSETFDHPVSVLVGGQAYMSDANLWKSVGADAYAGSATQSVEYFNTFNGMPIPNGHIPGHAGRN